MWSTDAVTTARRACRIAVMAPARSTRCMTRPPSMFPSALASLGSANSAYSDFDSLTGLPSSMWLFRGGGGAPQVALDVCAGLPFQQGRGEERSEAHGQGAVTVRMVVPFD